jgi:hypothetical protein
VISCEGDQVCAGLAARRQAIGTVIGEVDRERQDLDRGAGGICAAARRGTAAIGPRRRNATGTAWWVATNSVMRRRSPKSTRMRPGHHDRGNSAMTAVKLPGDLFMTWTVGQRHA